ncbi:septal ring lytic transglycosylase RlpA [Halovibrio salipaludis]|uniref:Endolytic peptidoglycan transglycosylase RlpA n=1 Tax=Halovibrio salipaludis TaxID=2032626 RepID=A0A2A2F382_9GAMM|nr:septal ring lytic transglycosylase RlpA family protein [Halovibrio salipaludis]PAU79906.1 septal ring lytic transglycosylase RlpA [Halovibrio salipaludis]
MSNGGRLLLLALVLLVAGCAGTGQHQSDDRYTLSQDTGPDRELDVAGVEEPEPRYEPPSKGGNKSPYEVWGKTYEVMDSAEGYEARGRASWYGRKFHGHLTSNGETYNMYELSAAHRSLPLPTYVRVTNLENDRSTIVRVNDRGPFHGERLIDLSYAAARVLGFEGQGTARVHIEAVAASPEDADTSPAETEGGSGAPEKAALPSGNKEDRLFVQVGAFGNLTAATQLKAQLHMVIPGDVHLVEGRNGDQVHRVWVGPFQERGAAEQARRAIERNDLGQPIIITRPVGSTG